MVLFSSQNLRNRDQGFWLKCKMKGHFTGFNETDIFPDGFLLDLAVNYGEMPEVV